MKRSTLLGLALLASCDQNAKAPERHSSAKDPPTIVTGSAADGKPDAGSPDGRVFYGEWVWLGADVKGTTIYVDRPSIHKVGSGHMTADIGYVTANGRALERVSFDCEMKVPSELSTIGGGGINRPDLVDSLLSDDPDGPTVTAYVCGRLPRGVKAVPMLPEHT